MKISKKENSTETDTFEHENIDKIIKSFTIRHSMPKNKLPQFRERGYSIIRKLSCLRTFFTNNTNTYICSLDHIDIVSSISYRQSDTTRYVFMNKLDSSRFTTRGSSVKNNR